MAERFSRQTRATLFALSAVLAWSTAATAFKLALRHLDHYQLLLIASIVSLASLGAVLAARGRFGSVLRATRRQYAWCFALGLLNPFLYYLVLLKAYDLLPAQVAQPLNFTWALTMTWLAIPLLGQRPRLRDLGAGVVCYAGVFLISTGGDLSAFRVDSAPGVALALGSTVMWALYWLGNARNDIDPVAGLFLNFAFGLPFVFAATVIFSDLRFAAAGLPAAVWVGAFEMGFTFVMWLTALKLTASTARVANLIFISPFLSLIFIHYGVGETIRGGTLAGLVLIVGGLSWQKSGKI